MQIFWDYFEEEHSDSKSTYTEKDIIKMLEIRVNNIFVDFAGKGFQTDNWHSHGPQLRPSPSRHISVLIRSGLKADMKSYKSQETAAIFYSSEPFLKQGIS